jgi:hypothetical protein
MTTLRDKTSAIQRHYAHGHDRPLGGYLGAIASYSVAIGGISTAARLKHKRPPARITPWDVTTLALATNKIARLLAKDPVTSPIRAPFTEYQGTQAPSELAEEVRGQGVQKTVGELVSCPFCLGQWVATALAGGLVIAPRLTRLVAATGAALFGADVLQYGYAALQQASE